MSKLFEAKLAVFLSLVALYFSVVCSVIFSNSEMAMGVIISAISVVVSMVHLDEVRKDD